MRLLTHFTYSHCQLHSKLPLPTENNAWVDAGITYKFSTCVLMLCLFVGDWPHTSQVVIVNYPQYCRYRAVLKRLDGCKDHWLRSVLVGALGGITTVGEKTRVLFCRDSFEHPIIQEHELRQDHLGKLIVKWLNMSDLHLA